MKWDKACDASVNNRAKRDDGDDFWLIVDRDSSQVSYDIVRHKLDNRKEGPRGPVARVLTNCIDENNEPFLKTKKMVDVTIIEKYDDWRPSVPRPTVAEVKSLEELEKLFEQRILQEDEADANIDKLLRED